MRTPVVLVLLLSTAAVAAGCTGAGGSSAKFSGDEKDVAKALDDFQSASQRDQRKKICEDLLAAGVLQKIKATGRTCDKAVDDALHDQDSTDLSVEDVRVAGTTARARVKLGRDKHESTVMTLTREGKDWKISSFTGQ